MPQAACMGAMMMCSFGVAPSSLVPLPTPMVMTSKKPAGTIMDFAPFANIPPFAMCASPANPAVAAALMIPQACTPMTTGPWIPGTPTVMTGKNPALNNTCMAMCAFAGVITISFPGQATVMV